MFYYLAIKLFALALFLASPFVRKAAQLRRGRAATFRNIQQQLDRVRTAKNNAPGRPTKVYWVHCASLGEFEQGRPVIEQIRERANAKGENITIAVSFFSPSGYEVRKNYDGADVIFYLPSDTPAHARRLVKILKPDVAIFVKYEYWHNLLSQLARSGAEIYLISAIFRPGMSFFKWYGGFFRNMLRRFTRLYVQDDASRELLSTIGITQNVTVAGDTRFDRVAQIASRAKKLDIVEAFAAGGAQSKIFVCGSTWPADETLLAELIKSHPEVKFIVAPHEIESGRIDQFIAACGRPAARYTQTSVDDVAGKELLVIDCIGILSSVYQYGAAAYIGGGFGRGIHNILEAATWGEGVIFGPIYQKFNEAVQLVNLGGAISIANCQELDEAFGKTMRDCLTMSEITRAYVKRNSGGTEMILNDIMGV